MPSYDYRCAANDEVVEVQHRMSEALRTWGELCERAGIDPGDTPADSPVMKVFRSSGGVVSSSALKNPEAPPCASGGCCGGGACGLQ